MPNLWEFPAPEDRANYQPVVILVLAFAFGIVMNRWFGLDFLIVAPVLILAIGIWWLIRYSLDWLGSSQRLVLLSICLLVQVFALGAAWSHARWHWVGANDFARYIPSEPAPCCIRATIVSEPKLIETQDRFQSGELAFTTIYRVRLDAIRDGQNWRLTSGATDLKIHQRATNLEVGDWIQVAGEVFPVTRPTNPGEFDRLNFFRSRSQFASVHDASMDAVVPLTQKSPHSIFDLSRFHPGKLRGRLEILISKFVSSQQAPLVSAILLGNREQIDWERRDAFLLTGTSHLLAISGLHVGILASIFFILFRLRLAGRVVCLALTMMFVLGYAWLVEFRSPVTRAAILITVFCLGRLMGRKSFTFNQLALAGLVVLLINPSEIFAIGTQLSFLAVATLIFCKNWIFVPPSQDPVDRLIDSTRGFCVKAIWQWGRKLRNATLASAAIWLVAMPLVVYHFHVISPIALVINPILLLPIAIALCSGLALVVLGWFSESLGILAGMVCDLSLQLMEGIICLGAAIPGGHFWSAGPSAISVGLFYAGVVVFGIYGPTRQKGAVLCGLFLAWCTLGWWFPAFYAEHSKSSSGTLQCRFVDVGHGTSALIQLPNGQVVLYDAGTLGSPRVGASKVAGVLWSEGIEHIDSIIISHADVDHFNALPRLIEQFSIGQIFVSKAMRNHPGKELDPLWEVIRNKQIKVVEVGMNDCLPNTGEAKMSILYSHPTYAEVDSDNVRSLVVLIEYLDRKLLLPGDLEGPGLDRLLAMPHVDCDIVMAPHHGSSGSRPDQFMGWSTPDWVVISRGRKSKKVEWDQLVEPGRVISTHEYGSIEFQISPHGIAMKSFSNPF
ncbi:MAG: DNA internalization-related competence protein ComEC/Rec2 [Planctomycetota bacterium]